MADFNKGDVVQLKSGGPLMTIDEIADYNDDGQVVALCIWFENNQRQSATFGLHTLTSAD